MRFRNKKPNSTDLKSVFFLSTRICFIYLSGCFACFQVKRKTDPRILLSSDLLLPLRGPLPLSCQAASFPTLLILCSPFSSSRGRPGASETSTGWLSCDSSMWIIIFITLYGIPLVVTKRHISFERLEPNQSIFKSRGKGDSGFPSSSKTNRCWTAVWDGSCGPWRVPFVGGVKCCPLDSWKPSSFVLMGIVDAALSCHQKNSTEDPSHIKEVVSGCRGSEIVTKKDGGEWGQYYQTLAWDSFLSNSSNVCKNRSSQWPLEASRCPRFLIYNLSIKAPIWLDPTCPVVYNRDRIRNNFQNKYIFWLAGALWVDIGKALLKCLYVLMCIDVFIYSIFIRRPKLIAVWWIL